MANYKAWLKVVSFEMPASILQPIVTDHIYNLQTYMS